MQYNYIYMSLLFFVSSATPADMDLSSNSEVQSKEILSYPDSCDVRPKTVQGSGKFNNSKDG